MTNQPGSGAVHDDHSWAQVALPWFVNDTLDERARRRFEAHLRVCDDCRLDLQTERQLAQRVKELATQDGAPETALRRLCERIDANAGAQKNHAAENVASTPRKPAGSLKWLAQAAVVTTIAIAVWTLLPRPSLEDAYQTRSATPEATSAVAQIQVVFGDNLTTAQIREILTAVGGEIVHGPTAAGLFEIRIEGNVHDNVDTAVNVLRETPGVVFATKRSGTESP